MSLEHFSYHFIYLAIKIFEKKREMDSHLIHSLEDLKSKNYSVRNGWQGRCAISTAEREEYMNLMRKGACTASISKLYEKRHKKKLAGSTIHNWRQKIKQQNLFTKKLKILVKKN